MFEPPDHYHNLSLRLSEVLYDIGINERIVMKRRRCWLLIETIINICNQIIGKERPTFLFGSQSEGSTTLELQSDVDCLHGNSTFHIIQDWSDWQPDIWQLMMVQDETTSPGYCLLQLLRDDVSFPVEDFQNEILTRDSKGRILMNHSGIIRPVEDRIRHGPAQAIQGGPGQIDNDVVSAIFCSSWPKEAEPWLQQQNINGWPTEDMKRYAAENGCFVVPVASRESFNQDTEWRISTSQTERCLMLNINMTQLRCYILMKMILKTYFKPLCEETISSFMSKNVLFHCIINSSASNWSDCNIIERLNQCLDVLLACILTETCPHFIIPRNNLLAGKLSIPLKEQLVKVMFNLRGNVEQPLLGISIEELGNRLFVNSGDILFRGLWNQLLYPEPKAGEVIAQLNLNIASTVMNVEWRTHEKMYNKDSVSVYQGLIQVISNLCQINLEGSNMDKIACRLYAQILCASLGSIASIGLYHSQTISQEALMWFSAGLNSDLSSTKLKLASTLYCACLSQQCETILNELSSHLEQIRVLSVCDCYFSQTRTSVDFFSICNEKNENDGIKQNIAFCVRFLPCGILCVPKELRYEFFRSTEEDRTYRGKRDSWMDWAAVDSLTYLHFMEYKVTCNTQLHRPAMQHRALDNLVRTINTELNLCHRETALNLLGQCMEQEHRLNAALCCYMMSLNERRRNNAANWHVCRLFARLFRHRQ